MIKGALDLVGNSRRSPRRARMRTTAPPIQRREQSGDLVRNIQSVLPLLFSTGLSVRDLYEIAKRQALVMALPLSLHSSGRPNRSLLSAMTGLTRPEVRSLLKEKRLTSPALVKLASSRSIRVTREWLALTEGDARFRRLRIRGKADSFQVLVQRFAGDVTVIAMQKELLRLGWIRIHVSANEVELLAQRVRSTFQRLV